MGRSKQRQLSPITGTGRQAIDWSAFEYLDRLRRLQGVGFDALGLGPEPTESVTVLRRPGLELKRYPARPDARMPFVLVPAPIKRSYIFDMSPEVSVVKRCATAGGRVFLVEWQPARAEFGLAQCVERLLVACEEAAADEPVVLIAHSLGGLLAAIYAALYPSRIRALVLIAAPLHFGPDAGLFHRAVADGEPQRLPESVPGSYIAAISFQVAPEAFGWERSVDFLQSCIDPEILRSHLRVERWTLDEFAMPRQLFCDIVRLLVLEDRFVSGKLSIDGHAALPSRISAPVLCVVDPQCAIVPPRAVRPFLDTARSRDKTVLQYQREVGVCLQHVGPLVGRGAHTALWPQVLSWLETRLPA